MMRAFTDRNPQDVRELSHRVWVDCRGSAGVRSGGEHDLLANLRTLKEQSERGSRMSHLLGELDALNGPVNTEGRQKRK